MHGIILYKYTDRGTEPQRKRRKRRKERLSSWQALAGPDMSDVRVLVQVRTFRVQNWFFEVIT